MGNNQTKNINKKKDNDLITKEETDSNIKPTSNQEKLSDDKKSDKSKNNNNSIKEKNNNSNTKNNNKDNSPNSKIIQNTSNNEIDNKIHISKKRSASLSKMSSAPSSNDDSDSSNSFPKETDNFSQPSKRILLQNFDDIEEDPEIEPEHHKIVPDIDTDLKSVFAGIRPLHGDYTQDEIEKYSTGISYRNDYDLIYYRKGEEIRRTYIEKLITKKVWMPSQKEKTHNSLIIFDWDDTLLCTSFLTPNGVFNEDMQLNEDDKEKIKKLEFSVLKVLTIAVEKGDVYIITNAGPGWVEFSAEKFYPSLKDILGKIKIISARAEYEDKFPGDTRKWKIQTFLNLQKNMNTDLVTNIICLGDSIFEMEAGHILASKFTQAFIKTVKFRESPKPEELNKQLCLVADQFNAIYSSVKNLTIRVEKKKNK